MTDKRLCIFDLDGTLADTVESIAYSANLALKELKLSPQPTDAFRYFAGDGVYELTKRCLAASGDHQGMYYEAFLEHYRQAFSKYCMYRVKPFEGICPMLKALKKRGILCAVLSNKPHRQTVDVVKQLFGEEIFNFVQGQQEGIPRKPDPTGALHIAELAGVSPDSCLYVGDTDTDMQTGRNAGMHTVGVLWGFRDREELEKNHAEYVISSPEKILELLEEKYDKTDRI